MDPGVASLIGETMKVSVALYLAYLRTAGKTEEEVNAQFTIELAKAMKFNPETDIKDV
jgi:hypothetical protein